MTGQRTKVCAIATSSARLLCLVWAPCSLSLSLQFVEGVELLLEKTTLRWRRCWTSNG